jgi:outer membrane protein assembly factor BamD
VRSSPTWLVLLLLAGGCELDTPKTAASLTYTEDAHAAYKEALEAFEERDWETARGKMQEVRRLFGYSRYARLAELRVADIDFEQSKYPEAVTGYRAFIRGHRADENVEYAKYRIGKALFLDISDTLLLPPGEERDQGGSEDAYRELVSFHERYPRSRYRVDAGYMLEVVRQRLVRHELYVARYYLARDNFDAALYRIDYALKTYPGSGLDPEALVLKGETLLKMHKPAEARAVFESVLRDHGGPFARPARHFLERTAAAEAGRPEPAPAAGPAGGR